MRKPLFLVLIFGSAFFLFGCPGDPPFYRTPTPAPTGTPTPTETPTPTRTATQTDTLPPTLEPAPSQTAGLCGIPDSTWESDKREFLGSILVFRVSRCEVASIKIFKYVVDGELYMVDSNSPLPIGNGAFEYSEISGAGKLIVKGVFDTAESSHGTMRFTKGFEVFGTVLSAEVIFNWQAAPV